MLSANGYFGPDVVAPFSAIWRVDDDVHLSLSESDHTLSVLMPSGSTAAKIDTRTLNVLS